LSSFCVVFKALLFVLFTLLLFVFSPLQFGVMPPPTLIEEKPWMAGVKELFQKGDYGQAISIFQKLLNQAGIAETEYSEIYRQMAIFYWYSDQDKEATQSYQKALSFASRFGSQREISLIKEELDLKGFYARAIELRSHRDQDGSNLNFDKAWRKSKSIGAQALELKVLRTWSFNYLGSPGNLKRFRDLNVQAINLALALNHKVEACGAACNIGAYYLMNSDYSHALSYYLNALYYVQSLTPNNDTIVSLNNISVINMALGDYARAYDYVVEALKLITPTNDESFQAPLLINLGDIFHSLAQSSPASDYNRRALECFKAYLTINKGKSRESLSLHALNGIANIYIDQGELAQARAILLPALEKLRTNKSPGLESMILLNLAEISLRTGEMAESAQHFQEALIAAKQGGNLLAIIRSASGLGRCCEQRKDYRQAIVYYNEAIGIIRDDGARIVNDINRAEFIFRSREPYLALIELYFKMFNESHIGTFGREIYRMSEMFRGRSSIEYQKRISQQGDPVFLYSNRLQEQRLNIERLNLIKEISRPAQKKVKYEELQSKIKHIDDLLDTALFESCLQSFGSATYAHPASLDIVQSLLLTDRTALIEYFLGDERSYIFCVTKKEFHFVDLPSTQSINDSLIGYLSFLEDPTIPLSKGFPAAQRLYGELLLPVEKFIPASVDHLIIVPDGILFRLPFETLATTTAGSSTFKYLNDRYVISYAPSASALIYLEQKPRISYAKEALAFGVSEYEQYGHRSATEGSYSPSSVLGELYRRSGFSLAPIPHSRKEITALMRKVRREKIDVYFDERATEKAFKRLDLKDYRLIHLACHALSDEQYPLRSSLVFSAAGDDEEDGFLQVSEMYDMRTNADLVILSACQTGRGKIVRNEGIVGLPRVIFYMGARSVLSTLWPVDDKASAVFMEYFYNAYYQGEGKSKALRDAKKKMANSKYGHPYYWASYTLTGEF
jgi:CHAT domain-containing protein